jgi:hypothetical protein
MEMAFGTRSLQRFIIQFLFKGRHMKRAFLITSFVFLCLMPFAHAKEFPLTASPSVPAAKGKVDIDKDHNGNRKVKLQVQHLAKPSALTPAQTNYVVWTQARGREPENKGQLSVDKNLEGKLETTTTYEAFDIFVTAEGNPNVAAPQGLEVLRGTIQP